MTAKTRDMTHGVPWRLALSFALPLMLGNVCQQLYTITDTAIVGQFAGIKALSALGSAEWMVWMVFGVISSVMHGFGIPMAQRFGAGDYTGLRRLVTTGAVLSLIIALSYTAIGLAVISPLLKLLKTRSEFYSDASAYLYILVSGAVFTTAYNFISSVLRSLGDSRSPLLAMICSSVLNIGLDLLFVWRFKWRVMGVAAATVISQAAACAVCAVRIMRLGVLKPVKGETRYSSSDAKKLIKICLPMALQSIMIGVGGMALQRVINELGAEFVAGFTATNKLYGLLEMAAVAFGMAVVTYVGQNLGAKQYGRIRRGIKQFFPLGIALSLAITALMLVFGKTFLGLFIEKDAPAAALDVAFRYLTAMSVTLSTLYLLYVYRSALLGIGDTFIPMVSGFAECFARVGMAILLTSTVGKSGIYWAETAAWSAAMIMLIISWYSKQAKLETITLKQGGTDT